MLAAFAAAGEAWAQPVAVRDVLGRTVTAPRPPRRIVTVFASNTELVAALGLVDRIVGVDALTTWPPEVASIPRVSSRIGFSVDAVVAQRPDLVLVTLARNAANQLIDPMERLGIPILVLDSPDMASVMANLRLVATVCGLRSRGDQIARGLEGRLKRVADRVAGRPPPRVVMITGRLGNGLVLVTRSDTYTGDAIRLAGGRFALARSVAPQVSPEAIWSSNPDVLLYAGSQAQLNELLPKVGWRSMRAVLTGRAHIVPRGELLIPGPRSVDGVERLAALFYPALAPSFQPASEPMA